jgi:Holliday junction resolvase RusA-like endonuclease
MQNDFGRNIFNTNEELISYFNKTAQDALDDSEYAEDDETIEECMSRYFQAKNMALMIEQTND